MFKRHQSYTIFSYFIGHDSQLGGGPMTSYKVQTKFVIFRGTKMIIIKMIHFKLVFIHFLLRVQCDQRLWKVAQSPKIAQSSHTVRVVVEVAEKFLFPVYHTLLFTTVSVSTLHNTLCFPYLWKNYVNRPRTCDCRETERKTDGQIEEGDRERNVERLEINIENWSMNKKLKQEQERER